MGFFLGLESCVPAHTLLKHISELLRAYLGFFKLVLKVALYDLMRKGLIQFLDGYLRLTVPVREDKGALAHV